MGGETALPAPTRYADVLYSHLPPPPPPLFLLSISLLILKEDDEKVFPSLPSGRDRGRQGGRRVKLGIRNRQFRLCTLFY